MATRQERFPSKYMRASDLTEDTVATILKVVEEQIGEERETKPVAYWREPNLKPYPLNVTNWDACAALSGKADDQQWGGLRVLLTKTQVMFKKELRDTIRIVAPPAPPKARPASTVTPANRPPTRQVPPPPEPDDPLPTTEDDSEEPF
jgi:hypothetical protein